MNQSPLSWIAAVSQAAINYYFLSMLDGQTKLMPILVVTISVVFFLILQSKLISPHSENVIAAVVILLISTVCMTNYFLDASQVSQFRTIGPVNYGAIGIALATTGLAFLTKGR